MKKKLIFSSLFLSILILIISRICSSSDSTVTVDFSSYLGKPKYHASGFIYGLSEDGKNPSNSMLTDLKCSFLACGGTLKDTPQGGYINGNYTGAWNSVKAYFDKCNEIDATLIILLNDLWGADGVSEVTEWPGDKKSWTRYDNFLNRVIRDAKVSGMTSKDVRWKLWNKPNVKDFWDASQNQWIEMWNRGYNKIKGAFPGALIEGPDIEGEVNIDNSWWKIFLNYIDTNNVAPEFITWNNNTDEIDPVEDKKVIEEMLSAKNIDVSGFTINKYSDKTKQSPGKSAWYISQLENFGIEGLFANKGDGELYTKEWKTLPKWWTYKCYGDMTGHRIQVSESSDAQINGIGYKDSSRKSARILLGNRGKVSGKVNIKLKKIPSWLLLNEKMKVKVERIPDGKEYLRSPIVVTDDIVTVSDDLVNIEINWTGKNDAYYISLDSINDNVSISKDTYLDSLYFVKKMKAGWNLGNALESKGGETSFGNPKTTKEMIDEVKKRGFNTIRIPVSYEAHTGSGPDYIIDSKWLDRVKEVIDYAVSNDLYIITNMDNEEWLIPNYENRDESIKRLNKLWEQIADKFKDYNQNLVFETINNPHVLDLPIKFYDGTNEFREVVNDLNLAAVNAIRSTGKENKDRYIMIPTYNSSINRVAMDALVIPNHDSRIIVSLQVYHPYDFSMTSTGRNEWGTDNDKDLLDKKFDSIYNTFINRGVGVVISEWGTRYKNNSEFRFQHAKYYVEAATKRNISTVWWDEGETVETSESTKLFNRNSLTWQFSDDLVRIIIEKAQGE